MLRKVGEVTELGGGLVVVETLAVGTEEAQSAGEGWGLRGKKLHKKHCQRHLVNILKNSKGQRQLRSRKHMALEKLWVVV